VTRIRANLPIAGLLAVAALVPVAALGIAKTHMVTFVPGVHILVVGVAGLTAGVCALLMSIVAARRHDARVVCLGMAFAVNAVLLLIHALATPGVVLPDNSVVAIAGGLNLPITAWILAAAGLPALRREHRTGVLLRIELAVVAGVATLGAGALVFWRLAPGAPGTGSLAAQFVLVAGSVPFIVLAVRASRTYLLTRRHADLIVAAGLVWLIGAEYGLLNFAMMDAAWWAAHALEISGVAMIGIPAALDLRHAVASRPLVGDLRAGDLVAHEEAFLGGQVRALLVSLGEKDPSTEGHTRRVATLAVAIGERLGLPQGRLRQLALGGLLHDIGKLSVPDHILNKPGQLTNEEFAEIRRHPSAGRALLTELGGFSGLVLELVENHHERLDGSGYPHGVTAHELDIAVRILTVADVYDALTAKRVYRDAWPVNRALALLDDETGTAFDPKYVSALRSIITQQAPTLTEAGPTSASPGFTSTALNHSQGVERSSRVPAMSSASRSAPRGQPTSSPPQTGRSRGDAAQSVPDGELTRDDLRRNAGEPFVDELHDHRALADGGRASFDRS
jgi:HD-GYP domain-containing protein (c-di-GMP phosphodiesterase class II)